MRMFVGLPWFLSGRTGVAEETGHDSSRWTPALAGRVGGFLSLAGENGDVCACLWTGRVGFGGMWLGGVAFSFGGKWFVGGRPVDGRADR